ncbi:uncharacterized protein C8R40DRAFT_1171625 [Lentinula edodes]|uniref:uncharacterized protein n=1 Tax=Lentinula edodes TaxID=5353 RepID=UPI001E8D45FF|nr:uncharacterized protein C8R40DRAFT_1171625 [Lentinula edodes]KAH7874127.1 hypothetical protein C8R40DRAFT_1171625 [Lentinula edodes]
MTVALLQPGRPAASSRSKLPSPSADSEFNTGQAQDCGCQVLRAEDRVTLIDSTYLISTDITLNTPNPFDLFSRSVQCTSSSTPTPLRELFIHKGEFSLRCITLLGVQRSTITTVFDLMTRSLRRVPSPYHASDLSSRQSSVFRPGLAVEEIVPLLNKRPVLFIRGLLQLPMLALLKPIFARWNQNAKLLSGHRRGRRISAIVRSGTRKEADNARRKAEGDKKDVQATAVRQELELMQKVSEM